MKRITSKILVFSVMAGMTLFYSSCTKDLLDQQPTVDLGSASLWKS